MSNPLNSTPAYRIKTVASMTELSTHLIRKWEERDHLVHPQRGPNGYRTFTKDDVQFLLYLESQLTHGETIGQLAESGEAHLRQAMRNISLDCLNVPNQFEPECRKLIQSAQNQEHDAIQKTIASWMLQLGVEETMEVILFPLLRHIGELWHQGKISFSAENSVSRIICVQLINALGKDSSRDKQQALIACMPGDNQEIAPLTVVLLLQKHEW